jgi:hypothetical protein
MLYFTRKLLEERRFMVEVRVSTSSDRISVLTKPCLHLKRTGYQDIRASNREVAYSTQRVSFCMAWPFGMVKTVRIWSLYVLFIYLLHFASTCRLGNRNSYGHLLRIHYSTSSLILTNNIKVLMSQKSPLHIW